jgi:hypothetical protein
VAIELYVSPPNGDVRRLVVASRGGEAVFTDTIDPHNGWARKCFANELIRRLEGTPDRLEQTAANQEEMDTYEPVERPEYWQVFADQIMELANVEDQTELAATTTQGIDHGWMTCADFMSQDVKQDYLCRGVVPEAQGGIASGRFKTLKTLLMTDLFFSMSTGTSFLGRFICPAPVPCALMTAESGAAAIMAAVERISTAKGIDYRDGPHLSTFRPNMVDLRHLETLERDIDRHGWKCLALDPTYLMFAGAGDYAANVFKMGQTLEPITGIIRRTGCSIILVNHNTKGRMKEVGRFDPPDLAEISMSGFAEWMRFWLLLAQIQEWDEVTGQHWLWLRTGGSAGHAGLHGLHVTEGAHDANCRRTKWQIEVKDINDTRREKENRKANEKAKGRERTEEDHVRRLRDALNTCDDFESATKLKELTGLNPKNLATAIVTLIKRGEVEQSAIEKRGNACDGYRLKPHTEQPRTTPNNDPEQTT